MDAVATYPRRNELSTGSPDEAHELIRRSYTGNSSRFSGDTDRFRFQHASVETERFVLARLAYSMTAWSPLEADNDIFVTRIVGGHYTCEGAGVELQFERDQSFVVDCELPYRIEWADLDAEVVLFDGEATRRLAAELTGTEPDSVRFDFSEPLSAARAAHWQSVRRHVEHDVLGVSEVAASPLVRAEAFRLLVATLVETFPNTALAASTDSTRRGPGRVEPAALRRALAFIEAQAHTDIGVGEIAAAARIGTRGLQLAFRRHRDTTPLRYLREVRLQRAHDELRNADPTNGDTVAAIATRWGFTHHGNFAAYYHQRFGCTPGQTLRG